MTVALNQLAGSARMPRSTLRARVVDVLGTPLQVTSYGELVQFCQQCCQADGVTAVDFSNTQIVTMRIHDPAFRAATDAMDHFVPDGMPLIWCLNRRGVELEDRVYGPTFMRECIANSPAPFTHYLIGGSEACLSQLKRKLEERNPSVRIVGAQHGYFTADQEEATVDEINRLSPDFVWVGLGTPKQQEWISRHKNEFKRGVFLAVGFAFDVNAGTKPDAPSWMQRRGLTWLYRLLSEPRRLAPRYLRYNSLFLWYLAKAAVRRRLLPAPY